MGGKLQELLESEAERLAKEFERASIEGRGTPQEVADRREESFISFIKKYFPYPYRIVKGNIIDSYGNNSDSIDCIILNPSHPYTIDEQNKRASVILADGVDYAIELKPDFANKKEIKRALIQIQSIKKLRRVRDGLLRRRDFVEMQIETAKTIPSFIVADKTYKEIYHLIKNIVDFYVENKIPQIEQFDYILINNRAIIKNVRTEAGYPLCSKQIMKDRKRAIVFWEGGEKSIALFLYEMNNCPRSEPQMSQDIMNIYLRDSVPKFAETCDDLNKRLIEAGV